MTLIPTDFPQRLSNAGLTVYLMSGWQTLGDQANHGSVVLHHTASSANGRPQDEAAYCHHGSDIAPCYNILVDRYGAVWMIAREESNNAGSISSKALNEALSGAANLTPAVQRGLRDDTSANYRLFAIAAQNNGTDEPWGPALLNSMGIVTAIAIECLGLSVGHVTTHRALTKRKIDPCGPGCPDDWHTFLGPYIAEDASVVPIGDIVSVLPVMYPPGKAGPLGPGPTQNLFAWYTHNERQIIGWNGAAVYGDVAQGGSDQDSIDGNVPRVLDVPLNPGAVICGISYGTMSGGHQDYSHIVAFASNGRTYAYLAT